MAEQEKILEQLRPRIDAIRSAMNRVLSQILLLREYRTRMIADVVTGKLDVREAAAELPEVAPLAEEESDDTIHAELDSNLEKLDAVKEVTL